VSRYIYQVRSLSFTQMSEVLLDEEGGGRGLENDEIYGLLMNMSSMIPVRTEAPP